LACRRERWASAKKREPTRCRSVTKWSALTSCDEKIARERVREASKRGCALVDVFPDAEREAALLEAEAALLEARATLAIENAARPNSGLSKVKLTSYEGAKGLSAQYVFLVGLHADELPRNDQDIKDIEICKFLVGLTRTKKRCAVSIHRMDQQ
jgi:superfamily I DNA/RNA helicase